jgi:hypothetical protein
VEDRVSYKRGQEFQGIVGIISLFGAVTACRDHNWQGFAWSVVILGYCLYQLELPTPAETQELVSDDR